MFADPMKNLRMLGLREDMVVADFGAGTGFYSIPLAHMLDRGKVYAVDVQRDFLKTIENKAREKHLKNLECVWGDIERKGGSKIADQVLDAVVISNVFCQVEDKDACVREVSRVLKKGGKVLLVEIEESSAMVSSGHHVCVSRDGAQALFEREGFTLMREVDTGDHHYGMIFSKQ